MNGKTDRVIRDRYEKLALDKVMRNRKESQYVGKDDSMTDIYDKTQLKQVIYFMTIMKVKSYCSE